MVSVQSSPVQGNLGFRVAPQVFSTAVAMASWRSCECMLCRSGKINCHQIKTMKVYSHKSMTDLQQELLHKAEVEENPLGMGAKFRLMKVQPVPAWHQLYIPRLASQSAVGRMQSLC